MTEKLWSVLRIYGVGGQLLKGIQAFCREANVCVWKKGSGAAGLVK